jgi:hypothetical protein
MDNLYVPLQFRFPDGLTGMCAHPAGAFMMAVLLRFPIPERGKEKNTLKKDAGKTLILIL